MMLIALAGLPGTGKSTLALRLAAALGGIVLNKDQVRAALFPSPALTCSVEQDEISMHAIYRAAGSIRATFPNTPIILDGRTFLRAQQVRDLVACANALAAPLHIIECVCSGELVRQRLVKDQAEGLHPAANRGFALYEELQRLAEPIQLPHLVVDTGALSLDECVTHCLAGLNDRTAPLKYTPLSSE